MPEKKEETPWLPILAGLGLMGAGLFLWARQEAEGGQNENPDQMSEEQQRLLVALQEKWAEAVNYHNQITANGRLPTDEEARHYDMLMESIEVEEKTIEWVNKTIFIREQQKFWHDLGLYVIIPSILGFMFIAGVVAYWIYKRPPPPPKCPKDGLQVSSPEELKAHIEADHKITTDTAALQAARAGWNLQPSFVTSSVGVVGQTYGTVYKDMLSWSFADLTKNVPSMGYVYGAEMGTMGTLSALGQSLAFLII
ncbi:MAG: hypothetical protein QUS33_08270 [Dehalococcoidia bacterium]|nr:hypothetical protein [Dehalococcoidia bacterium]